MPNYDPTQIANLAGQLGGDPQRAAQQLQRVGGQIDPEQHADTLRGMGIDPQKLQNGDYQQHLDAQKQPGFQSGQNFQQFDQDQGGMRGMEPDPNQQLSDDRQMAGRQADQMAGQRGGRQGRQQSGQQSGRPSRRQSEQQDDSDQQDQ